MRKRGLVILASDLLADPAALQTQLQRLRSRGHDIIIFRVLDPAELSFSFRESSIFEDVESGRRIFVDPEAARAEYLARFGAHAERLRAICRELGVDLIECATDRPLELSLLDVLRSRLRRGRGAGRRRSASRRRPA